MIRSPLFIRNFVFGVEDGLSSTVGLLSGIAVAGILREQILLTGAVLIFVEAFSMGIGSFLSESSVEEYEKQTYAPPGAPIIGATVMFFSYLVAGLIPLAPYFFLFPDAALSFSVALALIALYVLGTIEGRVSRADIKKSALRMVLVGGLAVLVGILVGALLK